MRTAPGGTAFRRQGALIAAALACVCGIGGGIPAGAQPKAAAAPSAVTGRAASANELVVSYLAAWNERDPSRRRALVARTWTDAGTYVDAHRHGEGHAAICTGST